VNGASLDERLAALAGMTPSQLRTEWTKVCKSAPPEAGPTLLRLGIAHKMQVRRHMDLDPWSLKEIARLGQALDRDGTLTTEPLAMIKPGTRLVREWHGITHQVLILEKGYIYHDRPYASLTRIACEITGARWSGPRFFGLAKRTGARAVRKGALPGIASAHSPAVERSAHG
jgi:hypothetical protein